MDLYLEIPKTKDEKIDLFNKAINELMILKL